MTGKKFSFKMTAFRKVLIVLGAISVALAIYRLVIGHEAVSNVSDHWPWGLWIGFNVMTGVALAGGGYGTALMANILHIRRFYVIARSALLVSLISYLFVMVSLFLDIGQWHNFWRPFVSLGHTSVLFEVFWCISLYTIVQILEFGEIATERVATKWHSTLKKAMPVLLVLGVMLPTLHQASLGGLYMIAVGKLYPLWWSPIMPLFFLLSSFFVGPATVTVVTSLTGKAYNHVVPLDVLQKILRFSSLSMLLYLVLLIIDLSGRGVMGLVFKGNLEGNMFILEILVMLVVPLVISIIPGLFNQQKWLVVFSVLVIAGVVINRMDVVLTGMASSVGAHYFPAIGEWLVTIGFLAISALAYMFIVENFKIIVHEPKGEPYYQITPAKEGVTVSGDGIH